MMITYSLSPNGLEYAAMLSGLSMAGDCISDNDIKRAKRGYFKSRDKKRTNRFYK